MDREKLKTLLETKSMLDSQGQSLGEAIRKWHADMIESVGDQFFDREKGWKWSDILYEVMR